MWAIEVLKRRLIEVIFSDFWTRTIFLRAKTGLWDSWTCKTVELEGDSKRLSQHAPALSKISTQSCPKKCLSYLFFKTFGEGDFIISLDSLSHSLLTFIIISFPKYLN